ncbi:MAG: 3-ketoacyl-ACP reductase [Rhodospirillales bacterium]|nr:3-ketoacyl-ACP reductase [Rhodospirillales bacterium]MDE0380386.1 3-ketoacyl-ACP reductase [Rhodospirillales bacterium]
MTETPTSSLRSRPVALVTGARRGIGAAIAVELAAAGCDVAYTDILAAEDNDPVRAGIEAAGGRALYVESDLADLAAHEPLVEAVADWGGGLDVLVNNAGIGSPRRGDMLSLSPEHFDRVMGVNLRGTFFLSQRVARWMVAHPRNDGFRRSIVSIGSVSAEMATPERSEYCISKAGLAMLTRLLALRMADEGVSVYEVRPGIIRTDMTASVKETYDRAIAQGLSPIRRWGEPADVARATAALVRGDFAFATGSVVHVDGGLSVQRL